MRVRVKAVPSAVDEYVFSCTVTKTFAQLVSDLDDRFLVQSDTHASIVKLLKFGLMGNITSGGEALDVHLASLMFNMCSKLHERPEVRRNKKV